MKMIIRKPMTAQGTPSIRIKGDKHTARLIGLATTKRQGMSLNSKTFEFLEKDELAFLKSASTVEIEIDGTITRYQ